MTIQEKIEKIFAGESDNRPERASELLYELREIKSMLQSKQGKKYHDYTFYNYVNKFRKSMMPDVSTYSKRTPIISDKRKVLVIGRFLQY